MAKMGHKFYDFYLACSMVYSSTKTNDKFVANEQYLVSKNVFKCVQHYDLLPVNFMQILYVVKFARYSLPAQWRKKKCPDVRRTT